ncbi:MAG: DUF4350 domain-containing protein [Gloeomargaritaceae cyanobacterium C42_A2020_066]|nr:DUF4350 domain-containing protein [Gloeomargaritaceae cyanobacterium C42_A2020_066]
MKRSLPTWVWIGLGVAVVLLGLILPSRGPDLDSGSTYSRKPAGYGAWYAYMEQRGTPVQRWQRPLSALETLQEPITLIRIFPDLRSADWGETRPWVEAGHRLILLGLRAPVADVPFRTEQDTSKGPVLIQTRRRHRLVESEFIRLGEGDLAVVWQPYGAGQAGRGESGLVAAVTPHIAANAYQDAPGNFAFLADLATEFGRPVWVDEYLHGHRDAEEKETLPLTSPWAYLWQSPVSLLLIQSAVLGLALIWGFNHWRGRLITLRAPPVDNTITQIESLAGLLARAGSTDFVLHLVGQAEQRQLQRHLGLGRDLLAPERLLELWQASGRPRQPLERLLVRTTDPRRIPPNELQQWLRDWQRIRHQLQAPADLKQ